MLDAVYFHCLENVPALLSVTTQLKSTTTVLSILYCSQIKGKKENGVTCCPASPVPAPRLDPQHMESEPRRPERLQPLGEVSAVLCSSSLQPTGISAS